MQFAVPTRNHKSSPYLSATNSSSSCSSSSTSRQHMFPNFSRRRKPIYALLGLLAFVILVYNLRSRGFSRTLGPHDAPKAVLVTVLERDKYSAGYIEKVIENRREYAEAHGYGLFLANITDYKIGPVPRAWTRIPAVRHAMSTFKYSDHFWYLDQNAIIMNPQLSLQEHVTNYPRLNTLMIKDVPIVPPDSVIRSYRHTPAERIQFILTQDHDGLNPGSFILRQGPWARYFLDVWFDPLFRLYNFQKAEQHALEHIVQWHPTILTKLALIPQRVINSFPTPPGGEGSYEDGDFVVHFQGCEQVGRKCEKEFDRLWESRGRASKKK